MSRMKRHVIRNYRPGPDHARIVRQIDVRQIDSARGCAETGGKVRTAR